MIELRTYWILDSFVEIFARVFPVHQIKTEVSGVWILLQNVSDLPGVPVLQVFGLPIRPEKKQNVDFLVLLVPDCRLLQRSNHEGNVRNKSGKVYYNLDFISMLCICLPVIQ